MLDVEEEVEDRWSIACGDLGTKIPRGAYILPELVVDNSDASFFQGLHHWREKRIPEF